MECSGTGGGIHTFLNYESYYNCCFCNKLICEYCCINEDEKFYCYDCFLSEVAVVPQHVSDQPTTKEMRNKLQQKGFETHNEDNVTDIADLYDAIVEQNIVDVYDTANFMENISLPIFASTYLDTEKVLFRFDLKNGGSFIRNDCCSISNKHDIIILLSKLVQTGNSKDNNEINKMFTILPDLIVEYANRSRLHSGYRLLKRAVRHALDPEGFSILTSNCCIVSYNNTVGLHISHCIKASMKKDVYNVKVSFTSTDILSVSCTCKAGSVEHEKVICVHILPLILQLSLLLFDGLAELVLIEFANENHPLVENIIGEEKSNLLKEVIIILKRANSEVDKGNLFKSLSIDELLTVYKVGTETFKRGPAPPTNKDKLGPLRNVKLISPLMKAKELIDNKKQSNIQTNISDNSITNVLPDDDEINNHVPYKILLHLIIFIQNHFKKNIGKSSCFEDCIGYRLLSVRAEKDNININVRNINTIKRKMLVAFSNACEEFRSNNNKKYLPDDKTGIDDSSRIENNIMYPTTNNIEDNIFNEEENIETNNIDSQIMIGINNNEMKQNKTKNRYTCCYSGCGATSINSPTLGFRKVPPMPDKKYTDKSTNSVIETYHRKKFIRKEWLKRLGLSSNVNNQNLRICTQHGLEYQLVDYKWINNIKEEQLTTKVIKLPKDPKDPPIKTRQQNKKRKQIYAETQSSRNKYKTSNNTLSENNDNLNVPNNNIPANTLIQNNEIPNNNIANNIDITTDNIIPYKILIQISIIFQILIIFQQNKIISFQIMIH